MFAGGVVRWLVERRARGAERSIAEVESGPGVLFSSGLIAGGALAGVAIAGVAAALVRRADAAQVPAADYLAHVAGLQGALGAVAQNDLVALAAFACLAAALYRVASALTDGRGRRPISPSIRARIIHGALVLGVVHVLGAGLGHPRPLASRPRRCPTGGCCTSASRW